MKNMDMYRNLDPDKIVNTIETLNRRIEERFSSSGLAEVCNELGIVANTSKQKTDWFARPNYLLRAFVGLIVVAIVIVLFYSISLMDIAISSMGAGELIQISEAALNDVVLIGAAIFFLVTVVMRIKRSRALDALHELRTSAHIIDMHQLTKDPSKVNKNVMLTQSSPKDSMSVYEIMRYLDYCSEMLSLTGKVAALYAQNFRDGVVLSSVNEIESLTTD